MKAKTVGETLALGSFGLDLLFDFEKGLLWSVGGPKRKQPPVVPLTQDGKKDLANMNKTDIMLGKMYAKWKMWTANFKVLEEHGITRQDLKKANEEDDAEGGKDSIIVAAGRRKAQETAKKMLASGRELNDDDVKKCLQQWGFRENTNRTNVTPDGQSFVHSDTIGIIKMSTCEKMLVTCGTKRYPEFTQLLTKWLYNKMPADVRDKFTYTSININKNYAAKRHRDGNNAGPSLIKAFGDFTGGDINYWPSDDRKAAVEDLNFERQGGGDKVTTNIKNNMLMFDGNRAHHVNDFKGDRFSIVFFSMRAWDKIPAEEAKLATKCGLPLPTKATMQVQKSMLASTGKGGYRVYPDKAARGTKRTASPSKGAVDKKRRVATPFGAR